MKQLLIGLAIGVLGGLTCTGCSIAKVFLTAEPFQIVMTDRNFVNTTKITTEEGVYRIFMIERTNGDGPGITAVKIK